MSIKVRFSLCFCSLFFFMIALTGHILSARPSPFLKVVWRFERVQCMSILLLSTRRNNLPMIDLKSPRLSVPCFFGIQVTIPFLSTSGEHPLDSQSVIWVAMSSGAILFKSHFCIPSISGAESLEVLRSLNDFIRRDRIIHFFKSIDDSLQRSAMTSGWRPFPNIRVMPRQQEVQKFFRDLHSLQTRLPNLDFF